jgi:hypothetical protein
MKQWATEGLAYLTLDADVKEEVVNDPKALAAIIQAAKVINCFILAHQTGFFTAFTSASKKTTFVHPLCKTSAFCEMMLFKLPFMNELLA